MVFLTPTQELTADRFHRDYGLPLFIADALASLPKPPPLCYRCGVELTRLPAGVAGWFCVPCRTRREKERRDE